MQIQRFVFLVGDEEVFPVGDPCGAIPVGVEAADQWFPLVNWLMISYPLNWIVSAWICVSLLDMCGDCTQNLKASTLF